MTGPFAKLDWSTLAAAVTAKVRARQHGIPTFFDNFLLRTLADLRRADPGMTGTLDPAALAGKDAASLRGRIGRIQSFLARREGGRFVELRDRPALPGRRTEADLSMSQGTWECLQWRGLPLLKTVYDFALYPMLIWDVRPATVIELGSGSGASALWMADLLESFALDARVYSVDLQVPAARHDRVTFLAGDCTRIEEALEATLLASLPHPWVLIEDAHVNVAGVLGHIHGFAAVGDYLVVEDSAGKRGQLEEFLRRCPDSYRVDTHYTDFFGHNATSCFDSFLVRQS